MIIDFNKLIEFNNKHPDSQITALNFVILNMIISEDVDESILDELFTNKELTNTASYIFETLEKVGLVKLVGDKWKDVSIRDLGLELIGQSKSDSIIELAEKVRDMFPKGVKSGGGYVRSEVVDIADKLRKFFKKHKYTQEEVLEATKRYVERKRNEGYSFMHQAVYFIEKNNISLLATECGNLKENEKDPSLIDTMKRL